MARLTVVIDTRLDPTLYDPDNVAEDVIDTFNQFAETNGIDPVDFVRAEWGHHLNEPRPPLSLGHLVDETPNGGW